MPVITRFLVLVVPMLLVTGCKGAQRAPSEPAAPGVSPPSTASSIAKPTTAAPAPARKIEIREQKHENGMVKERIEGYVNEKGEFVFHGAMTRYFDDGAKQAQLQFADGKQEGERVTWYQTGQMAGRGYYKNGLEDGTWTAWFPNGFIQREWHMRDGVWHGMFNEFHDNGERKIEFEFVNGLKQGKMTIWNPEGRIVSQSEYVDDVEQP